MRKSYLIQVEGIKRGKGRPKVILVKVEKKNWHVNFGGDRQIDFG